MYMYSIYFSLSFSIYLSYLYFFYLSMSMYLHFYFCVLFFFRTRSFKTKVWAVSYFKSCTVHVQIHNLLVKYCFVQMFLLDTFKNCFEHCKYIIQNFFQVLVKLVAGTSSPLLGSYQKSIPLLPVPRLDDTCSRVSVIHWLTTVQLTEVFCCVYIVVFSF